ncbi:MAG: AI-2E family transporter [Nanoarchaeota archaeon]
MAKNLVKLIILIIALGLAFLVIRPFLTALVFAAVVAYALQPIHSKLSKKIGESASRYLMVFAALIIGITFLAYGTSIFINELAKAYMHISGLDINYYNSMIGDTVKSIARVVFTKAIENLSGTITSIPKVILSVFIFFSAVFYLLKDGPALASWVKKAVPLETEKKNHLVKEIERYTYAYLYVWMMIAAAQGIIASVLFYLFGLPYVILAGIVVAILSFLPIVGPGTLYIPAGIALILSGQLYAGIGLMAIGLAIGGVLDYVLRPYFAGQKAKAHPLLMLIGILGGLMVMGSAGLIVGPIVLICAAAMLGANAETK